MLIWFAAMAFLIVVHVFNSPALDYRLVMAGALLPVAEVVAGGPYLLHTLLGSVLLFGAVSLVAWGRRLVARRLVGLPIGTFLHLVLDGTWTDADLFWWPLFGVDAIGRGSLPEHERLGLSLGLEVVGIVVAVWLVRRFELTDPRRRELFLRRGQLGRDLVR